MARNLYRLNPRFLSKESMRKSVDGACRRSGAKILAKGVDLLGVMLMVRGSDDRRLITEALSNFGVESEWSLMKDLYGKDIYRISIDYLVNVVPGTRGDHRLNPTKAECPVCGGMEGTVVLSKKWGTRKFSIHGRGQGRKICPGSGEQVPEPIQKRKR